jgi:hypothetical protein
MLAKSSALWPSARHNNIDDHGSRRGDMAPILARRRHQVALSEALSMPHWVIHNASSGVATKFIKDKNNHQNHVSNWDFLVYYSYVGLLHNGTDILEEDVWSPEGDACRIPSLLTSSGLHH